MSRENRHRQPMKTTKPFDINQVRKDIDRVDTALLSLIAERLELANYVKQAKRGGAIWRPSREESHVRDLADATRHSSPALVSRIWAELMSASLSIQGPLTVHVGIKLDQKGQSLNLVRERFGASLPFDVHSSETSALAAAYGDENAVAVVAAPGSGSRWWTALAPTGAMPDLKIMARLPRHDAKDWPEAVAVAVGTLASSGDDMTLFICRDLDALPEGAAIRAERGGYILASIDGFKTVKDLGEGCSVVGVLPAPLSSCKASL